MLAVFALDGLACETLHDDQIAHAHGQRNDLIRNIAFDGLTLTVYECRAAADPSDYLSAGAGFGSPYAETLDLTYREQLYSGLLYSNPLFLAVQVGPARPFGDFVGSRVERRQAKADAEDSPDDRLRRLETVCDQIAASLSAYRPRRLGIRRRATSGLSGEHQGVRSMRWPRRSPSRRPASGAPALFRSGARVRQCSASGWCSGTRHSISTAPAGHSSQPCSAWLDTPPSSGPECSRGCGPLPTAIRPPIHFGA